MNRKEFFGVALWAAGSFIAGLAFVLADSSNATAPVDAGSPNQGKNITVNGCEIACDPVNAIAPGKWRQNEKPSFKITATNKTRNEADMDLCLTVVAYEETDSRSRVSLPAVVSDSLQLSMRVPAGETMTKELTWEEYRLRGSANIVFSVEEDSLLSAARRAQRRAAN